MHFFNSLSSKTYFEQSNLSNVLHFSVTNWYYWYIEIFWVTVALTIFAIAVIPFS